MIIYHFETIKVGQSIVHNIVTIHHPQVKMLGKIILRCVLLSLIKETLTTPTITPVVSPLQIIEVSRVVLNSTRARESLLLELQWINEDRMNITALQTYYWGFTWPPYCGYEGGLPLDPESHLQVWGCATLFDAFTMKITSQVYGNHSLGVTVGRVPHIQDISSYIYKDFNDGKPLNVYGPEWRILSQIHT